MTKITCIIIIILCIGQCRFTAQVKMKPYKAGHVFDVQIPDYMVRSAGLNASSSIEFHNALKDIAGFIIYDTKQDLELAEMPFSSINEFYENFISEFLKEEKSRKISTATSKTIGKNNYIEGIATYYDEEAKSDISYYVGIIETAHCYYKVICFGSVESVEKYKQDFQKITYSVAD